MNNEMINENSRKESYEPLRIDVTAFDSEDVITTSGVLSQALSIDPYEQSLPPLFQ